MELTLMELYLDILVTAIAIVQLTQSIHLIRLLQNLLQQGLRSVRVMATSSDVKEQT